MKFSVYGFHIIAAIPLYIPLIGRGNTANTRDRSGINHNMSFSSLSDCYLLRAANFKVDNPGIEKPNYKIDMN